MPADPAMKTPVPPAITTPSKVETGIGALEFTDGYPTAETASRLRDHLDYLHGVEAFMNSIQGVSTYALRQGLLEAGVMDGSGQLAREYHSPTGMGGCNQARSHPSSQSWEPSPDRG